MSDGNGPTQGVTVGQRLNQLRDATAEYYEKAKDTAVHWKEGSEEYIRQRPLTVTASAALIGIGVGFLVGYLVGRRQ
jgi:ElaB/YqjD/DUF883 family membrane-anchored ribosome-binding protein